MTLNAFAFSKDRACQLDLLLRSCQKNCPGLFRFHILYKSSLSVFADGYRELQRKHSSPAIEWIAEDRPLKEHFLDVIRTAEGESKSLCLFTDDCVFFRPWDQTTSSLLALMSNPEICTYTFRLGRNTVVQDYQTGRLQPPLQEDFVVDNFLVWNYRPRSYTENYGYPFGMDGHVFRAADLRAWTEPMAMKTFRDWEGALHLPQHRDAGDKPPYMACSTHSYVVNIPANSVQVGAIPSGLYHPSGLLDLNHAWLGGYHIDLESMDFSHIQSSHIELPWRLIPR